MEMESGWVSIIDGKACSKAFQVNKKIFALHAKGLRVSVLVKWEIGGELFQII